MKIRPVDERVLVKPLEEEEYTCTADGFEHPPDRFSAEL